MAVPGSAEVVVVGAGLAGLCAARVLDHAALDLRASTPGALVRVGDRLHRVTDPRRRPLDRAGRAAEAVLRARRRPVAA